MLFFKGRKVKQIHVERFSPWCCWDDHLCVIRFFWCSHPQLVTPQQAVITNFWPDASVIIDAAYESPQSDRVLLFKGLCPSAEARFIPPSHRSAMKSSLHLFAGCCVWAFSGYDLMTGYPKSIPSFGLPTAVEKDAAPKWPTDQEDSFLCRQQLLQVCSGHTWGISCLIPFLFQLWRGQGGHGRRKPQTSGWHLPGNELRSDSGSVVQRWASVQLFSGSLGCNAEQTGDVCPAGFFYLYSGPYMYEFSQRTGKLLRVLRNSYFLSCFKL